MTNKISDIRNDYGDQALSEPDLPPKPIQLLEKWIDEAIKASIYEPTALTLTTIDSEGYPSPRIVLLKEIQDGKLVFFSNFKSAKAKELEVNSKAGFLFFWPQIHRQIRIIGRVKKLSDDRSDAYFNDRPFESKLGAWASPQSEVISDRNIIESKYQFFEEKYKDKEIPRPEFWGGYELNPIRFEFWQGRSKRLHDRLVYTWNENSWGILRLAP